MTHFKTLQVVLGLVFLIIAVGGIGASQYLMSNNKGFTLNAPDGDQCLGKQCDATAPATWKNNTGAALMFRPRDVSTSVDPVAWPLNFYDSVQRENNTAYWRNQVSISESSMNLGIFRGWTQALVLTGASLLVFGVIAQKSRY